MAVVGLPEESTKVPLMGESMFEVSPVFRGLPLDTPLLDKSSVWFQLVCGTCPFGKVAGQMPTSGRLLERKFMAMAPFQFGGVLWSSFGLYPV